MSKSWGLMAEFENPHKVYETAKKLNAEGYKKFEVYSPFPIHGMDKAMGLKGSFLPWIVLALATSGLVGASLFIVFITTQEYPMIISAKPDGFLGFPEFFPIIFEITILSSAFGAVFGMIFLNKLWNFNKPEFEHPTFEKASDDGFFISVLTSDDKFNEEKTKQLLTDMGGFNVESIHE